MANQGLVQRFKFTGRGLVNLVFLAVLLIPVLDGFDQLLSSALSTV